MKKQITKFEVLILLTGLLLVGSFVLSGCGKCMMGHKSDKSMSMGTEQKYCPLTDMPINKDIWTEYKGKKVYFCSPACKAEFEKNPEKYISKLPQFKG